MQTEKKRQDAHLVKKDILIDRGIIKGNMAENIRHQAELPRGFTLNLCGHCTYRCTYCPQSLRPHPPEYIELEVVERVFQELEGRAVYVQMGTRGENLLHPRFFDVLRVIKDSNPRSYVCLNTNAFIIDDAMMEGLLTLGLDHLVFSLQTMVPELYANISGSSHHAKVVDRIKRCIARRQALGSETFLSVQYLAFPENLPHKRAFLDYWQDYDIEVQIQRFHGWGDKFEVKKDETVARYPCHYLWLYPTVTHSGNLVPCFADFYDEMAYGSLKTHSLRELWQGEKIRELRELHLQGRWGEIPMCKDCEGFLAMDNGFRLENGRFVL